MILPPGIWPLKKLPGSPLDYLISIEKVDDIPFAIGRELYELWDSKRAGRLFPDRFDFRPEEMEALVPNVTFLHVERNPLAFRMHLVGTEIVNEMRFDIMGFKMEDVRGMEDALVRFRWLLSNKQPYYCPSLPLEESPDGHISYSIVCLPLSSDGEIIDWIITCLNWEKAEDDTG